MAYIPRSSLTPSSNGAIPAQIERKRSLRVLGVLSMLILIGSLAAAAASFLYKQYSLTQLGEAKTALQAVSDIDNEKYIEEIRLYDKKLRIASRVLDAHIAPTNIFQKLEGATKETVQFESLEFSYDPGFEATLVVKGLTKEFASMALQKIQFSEDGLFSHFVLHDIGVVTENSKDTGAQKELKPSDVDSKVGFTVTGLFKKDGLMYTGLGSTPPNVLLTNSVPKIPTSTPIVADIADEATTTATTTNPETP